MSDKPTLTKFVYTDGSGKRYEIFVEAQDEDLPAAGGSLNDRYDGRGGSIPEVELQQATNMIRGYTAYAVSAFKEFGAAKVEEVTLKFGLKVGGKVGIPYITEGSAESNLEIQVKCTFPDEQSAIGTEVDETS